MANNTVLHPYVPLADFDWSFSRVGPLPWTPAVYCLIAAFAALAIWSSFPLTIRILYSWPRRSFKSLYFWSIMFTSWGACIREVGFVLRLCVPTVPWIFSLTLAEVGWTAMVTGFSVVMWSRLRYLSISPSTERFVLAMIIVGGVTFHTMLWVTQFGLAAAKASGSNKQPWLNALNPMERIQVSWFMIQETIISCFYIRAACQYLEGRPDERQQIRKAMKLLITVQVVCFLLDLIVVTIDVAGYFNLKAVIHSFVYALKLELEMAVLNQLRGISQLGVRGLTSLSKTSSQSRDYSSKESPPDSSRHTSDGSWDAALVGKAPWDSIQVTLSAPITSPPRIAPPTPDLEILCLGKIPEDEVVHQRSLSLDTLGVIPKA